MSSQGPPRKPKGAQRQARALKASQGHPKGSPMAPQKEPRPPQREPKGAQGRPKEAKGRPRAAKRSQRAPKATPKEAKGTPKTPKANQKAEIYISNSRSTAPADVMLLIYLKGNTTHHLPQFCKGESRAHYQQTTQYSFREDRSASDVIHLVRRVM